jgi:hypothetical protein
VLDNPVHQASDSRVGLHSADLLPLHVSNGS